MGKPFELQILLILHLLKTFLKKMKTGYYLLAEEENHGGIDESMETEDEQADEDTAQLPSTSKLPEGAHSIPIFEQSKWPKWRKTCWTDWHGSSGKVLAKCKFCSSGIYHSGNKDSYSNFLRHIKRNHVEEYGKIPKSYPKSSLRQSSMTPFVCNGKKTSKAKKEQLDKLVTLMICKDNLPLTILKREGFRNLMAVAVPDYQIPSYE
ncbi:uncharacterized protein LOC116936257 [Daphnia magna]|uniref:uncharacterized protein LOC116936257 n=1 Tax=Daphnia magna TaxID=35525 RepID=UPI0014024EA1|nr:uncharacterized protein LOC116936257 [Daphnia magna]